MSFSSATSFVHNAARLVSDEVAAQCVRITDVVVSAFDSLQWDLQITVELLHVAEREGSVSTAHSEASETPFSMHVIPGNN